MSKEAVQLSLPGFEQAQGRWRAEYGRQIGTDRVIRNRSQIEIQPLYTPRDWNGDSFLETVGFPGQYPFTRGIYPTMHRGRTWTQRQLIGLGTPEDYNKRVRVILDAGASAISLLPCNSGFRGVDCDEVDPLLLGTCGTVINTTDHMDHALDGVPLGNISTAMNDPSPFTLLAFTLAVAKRRGIPWTSITGTSNQSDYISHFIANHMFYRLSLPGARRVLTDHVEFCRKHVPGWNPVSVVGQHMQQAGATPVETMAFTLSTALQYAQDCIDRGMDIDCCGASPSSSTYRSAFSRRSPNSAPGGASGRGWRANGWTRRTPARGASNSTARRRALTSPSSSRSTISRASRYRRWPAS
jgi:methylmalonyl-CoA mutase, N-terminal domain